MTLHDLLGLPPAIFVDKAYLLILGRHPDDAGRLYYLKRLADGHSKASVIHDLAQSEEGRQAASKAGDNSHLPDEAFVDYTYQRILGRLPDPGGKTYYLAELKAGVSRATVFQHVADSLEARVRRESGQDFEGDLQRLIQQQKRLNTWFGRFSRARRAEQRLEQLAFYAEQRHWDLAVAVQALSERLAQAESQGPAPAAHSGDSSPERANVFTAVEARPYPAAQRAPLLAAPSSPLAKTFHRYVGP